MNLKRYQLDAFTDILFGGNPAAVCPLNEWLPDELLQNIAMENNQTETAFYVLEKDGYRIRWFTPEVEVDLCGHATLAVAQALFFIENYSEPVLEFQSRSGILRVVRENDLLTLNFPTDPIREVPITEEFLACFSTNPIKIFNGLTDYMFIYKDETQITEMKPDLMRIGKLDARGVIIAANGNEVDFVSRFFAPQSGIDEDPVTGSAHTSLTPYWKEVLQKDEMTAIQLSKRKGFLKCKYLDDRVEISGKGRLYMSGEIYIE